MSSSGSSLLYLAVAIGLVAGVLLGAQPSANGFLGRHVAHPLQASVISFGTGLLLLVIVSLVCGCFPPRLTTSWGSLPWWSWIGGSIGVFLVTTSLFFVPRVGSLPWLTAVITGQIAAALVLDHWGLMGNPRMAISPARVAGVVLLLCGVLLITRDKASSAPADASSPQRVAAQPEEPLRNRAPR